MTGYGKSVASWEDKKICVEVRSLNGKAMDLSARLAPQYKSREMEVRTLVSNVLERGKVDLAIWVEQNEKVELPSINVAVMQAYVSQMQAASEQTGVAVPENLFEVLLRMPDVVARKEIYEVSDDEWKVVMECVNNALADLLPCSRCGRSVYNVGIDAVGIDCALDEIHIADGVVGDARQFTHKLPSELSFCQACDILLQSADAAFVVVGEIIL